MNPRALFSGLNIRPYVRDSETGRAGLYSPPTRWAHFIEVAPNGCWLWTGSITRDGYGRAIIPGRRTVPAHRAVYEVCVGPVAEGFQLDHLCHTSSCSGGITCPHRRCCNPAHVEPVTLQENHRRMREQRRPAVCPRGHAYDEANTYHRPSGGYYCLTCRQEGRYRKKAS